MGTKGFFIVYLLNALFLLSCISDDAAFVKATTLETDLTDKQFVLGNVIACAASNEDPTVVSLFLYPRDGATNISYYQTESIEVDQNDFSFYTKVGGELLPVFNGYLLKYEIAPVHEKWLIVTFEEGGKVHLSNPIRLKQNAKPTAYLPEIIMLQPSGTMPIFTWEDGVLDDAVIYFQVVSNANNDLLSGTYTVDRIFQYYTLDNVVLNITPQQPPDLEPGPTYGFTLLAVSEDNWVNLFSSITFSIP